MSEPNIELRPRGGVGVYIVNSNNEVLLTLRSSAHATGTWCPPGGHIEYGESFLQTAARETKEEVNMDINSIEVAGVTGDVYPSELKHYVTVHVKAGQYSGEAKIMEPHKCAEIKWFSLDSLPDKLFPATKSFLDSNPLCLCGSGKKYRECHGKNL